MNDYEEVTGDEVTRGEELFNGQQIVKFDHGVDFV